MKAFSFHLDKQSMKIITGLFSLISPSLLCMSSANMFVFFKKDFSKDVQNFLGFPPNCQVFAGQFEEQFLERKPIFEMVFEAKSVYGAICGDHR